MLLLIRSGDDQWIEKWEDTQRLTNFRAETIPPEHDLFERRLYRGDGIGTVALDQLQAVAGP